MSAKKAHHQADSNYVQQNDQGGYIIKPRGLNIVWGNDSRYWKLAPDGGEAELMQVSWLEVSGMVKVEKEKAYEVKFHVRVKEDGFGWKDTRVLVMAKLGKRGKYKPTSVVLKKGQNDHLSVQVGPERNPSDDNLYFGLYEVWSGKWKSGLIIDEVTIERK